MAGFRAYVKDGKVLLEMPIKTLVFACEHHPEVMYKVRNHGDFGKWIADNIIEHNEGEDGLSDLHRLLDSMFDEAASSDIIDCDGDWEEDDDEEED